MGARRPGVHHGDMSQNSLSRPLLVADRPASGKVDPGAPRVRRYRLARLELNTRRGSGDDRHSHLKRSYD